VSSNSAQHRDVCVYVGAVVFKDGTFSISVPVKPLVKGCHRLPDVQLLSRHSGTTYIRYWDVRYMTLISFLQCDNFFMRVSCVFVDIDLVCDPHNPATGFRPPSATVVSTEPFLHGTGTLWCLQKEMATCRHWSVSLWRDPDDVPHCRILSSDEAKWRLIPAALCRWRRCFLADQLWFVTRIREEEDWPLYWGVSFTFWLSKISREFYGN